MLAKNVLSVGEYHEILNDFLVTVQEAGKDGTTKVIKAGALADISKSLYELSSVKK